MKKLLLVLLGVMTVAITGCSSDGTKSLAEIVVPTTDLEFNVGDLLDLTSDVMLKDEEGKIFTNMDVLEVVHSIPVDENNYITNDGTYTIEYQAIIGKTPLKAGRTVVVSPALPNNSSWTSSSMGVSGADGNVKITYGALPEYWWDLHAVMSFDEVNTHNAISITFVGTTGHNYLFKAEANEASLNSEIDVTATGQEQTIKIYLNPKFTEAQYSELKQLLFFTKTGTGSVTIKNVSLLTEERPVVDPYWSCNGVEQTNNDFKFLKYTNNFWDHHAVYNLDGQFTGKEAVRITATIPAGEKFMFKIESVTGAYDEVPFIGTGQEETYDVSGPNVGSDLVMLKAVVVFWLNDNAKDDATINIKSIEGITANEIEFAGSVSNTELYNGNWIAVTVVGNKFTSTNYEDFTFAITADNITFEDGANTYENGWYILRFMIVGGYQDNVEYSFNLTISNSADELASLNFTAESKLVAPEGQFNGSVNSTETYGEQYVKVFIENDLSTHQNAKLFTGELRIDGFDNINYFETMQHGTDQLILTFNLGESYGTAGTVLEAELDVILEGNVIQTLTLNITIA